MEKAEILWEDKSLLLCVKPVGLLSQPTETEGQSLLTLLQQEREQVQLVHRLDRAVGGVMVFSKTPAMTGKLSQLIQQREFEKEYLAVVKGRPPQEGVLKDLLFRDTAKNKTYVVDRPRKGVRGASLEYRLLQTVGEGDEQKSLVRVRLHTGRTHQIRVQFASRGWPLLGDGKYGSRDNRCAIALWSARVAFQHPFRRLKVQGEKLPPAEYPWNLFTLN